MFASPLEHRHMQQPLVLLVLFLLHVVGGVFTEAVMAETWVCSRPGQTDLYMDHGGAGCSQLGEAETYSSLKIAPAPAAPSPMAVSPSLPPIMLPSGSALNRTPPSSFPEVSISFPIVAVNQPIKGLITGSWTGLMVRLTVGHLASGKGPEILTDGNLMPEAMGSLRMAVVAAATVVGYDPKFLKIRLLVPMQVDGPSAGGMYAVGIASVLLGDEIRRDVCMSGTIEPTLEIKPVGRLADKMNACQQLNKTTMIVPDGLDNSHLSFKGTERAIHVIEVHTLDEAYSAATGQVLRQASL